MRGLTHEAVAHVLHEVFSSHRTVLDGPAGGAPQGKGVRFTGCWWDGPWGIQLRMSSRPEAGSALLLGLAPTDQGLALLQMQCAEQTGNRWLFSLRWCGERVSPRVLALLALHQAFPDVPLYAPDGEQKCAAVLGLHGGFTVEELEDCDFAEWLDGEAALPRIRRAYDELPAGWSFGEALELPGVGWVRHLVLP